METKTQMDRPPPGGVVTAAAFEGDEIEELGERIASLTPTQARRLCEYLDSIGATERTPKPPESMGFVPGP